jgi:hypothetical protein
VAARLVSGGNLYYALGGGLGHLTRARNVLAALGIEARVICRLPRGCDQRVVRGLDLLPVPDEAAQGAAAFAGWLERLLWEIRPQRLYLDCFPAGLFGELSGIPLPPGLGIHHLARLLRWDNYRPLVDGQAPRLQRVHLLEPLHPEHREWLERQSDEIDVLGLPIADLDQPAEPPPAFMATMTPRWLVVHSGPSSEIDELLAYAREMAVAEGVEPGLVVVAPAYRGQEGRAVTRLTLYPASPLFALADRIVSACGFNIMQETAPYRSKHRFLPMERRFDDQFARASRYREASLGDG